MSRRLDGINPLAYMGVKPVTPAQMVVNKERRPTSTDLKNFQLGTWWIIPKRDTSPSQEVWILINKTATTATWIELDSGGGSVVPGSAHTLLTPDGSGGYGSNVGPGTAGQVLLSGGAAANPDYVTPTAGTGLSVTSNASTLEYSLSSDVVLNLAGNTGGDIPPDGGGTINIVGSGGVNVSGAANTLTITTSGTGSGFSDINVQTFTTNGTYTPTSGMAYCVVECVGGGGGGGQADDNGGAGDAAAAGGGAAGYCRKVFASATIGASQSVTIGSAGSGGTGGSSGATGGNTTFGALLTANGGVGGQDVTHSGVGQGGDGGTASSGDINIPGQPGFTGIIDGQNISAVSGAGGSGPFGSGGKSKLVTGQNNASGYGAGGSGAAVTSGGGTANGGNGSPGLVVVTEYIE